MRRLHLLWFYPHSMVFPIPCFSAAAFLCLQRRRHAASSDGPDTTSHNWFSPSTPLARLLRYSPTFAIVNDSLAYAVGEMYLRDSVGILTRFPTTWQNGMGNRWQPMRIPVYTICGGSSTNALSSKIGPCIQCYRFVDCYGWKSASAMERDKSAAIICMPRPVCG